MLNGPLRSIVLSLVPRDHLATGASVVNSALAYFENHAGERIELLRNIPFERVRPLCEQLLAELVLDGFVLEVPGRELALFVAGLP